MESTFLKSTSLLFFLLNPLFMSIYLLELFKKLDSATFIKVLIRAALIATIVFCLFAYLGDQVFQNVFQARFLAFQIFGGIIFLIIGIQMVLNGNKSLALWREEPRHLSGSIAMPFFIGPGTVMASVLTGSRLEFGSAVLSITLAVGATVLLIIVLKKIYDMLTVNKEELIKSYVNIVGRIMALLVGTFSVEMILKGLETWIVELQQLLGKAL